MITYIEQKKENTEKNSFYDELLVFEIKLLY